MIPRFMLAALCLFVPLTCIAHGGNINGEATYISFSVPGATGTYAMSINSSMQVTGYYTTSPQAVHGFLREADGTILTINVPGADSTQPESINAAGDIAGRASLLGFLRYADGRIVTFGKDPASYIGTEPASINDFDEIAGTYTWRSPSAFTRSRAGVIDNIPASTPDGSSYATAINASGVVVGFQCCTGPNDFLTAFTGFVAHTDGYRAEISVPGNPACANQTIPIAINAGGSIAGLYTSNYSGQPACSAPNTGGFVISPTGELTLFQSPGTMPMLHDLADSQGQIQDEVPHWISMDEAGDITGWYVDPAGAVHGFVRNPYGTITSFDPPEGKETFPTSINNGGWIAGYYTYRAGGETASFIRVPQ
jgi:hypothetical protein